MSTSTHDSAGSSATWIVPWTFVNLPRTLLTIKCRATNSTLVCTGSSCHSPGSSSAIPSITSSSWIWLIVTSSCCPWNRLAPGTCHTRGVLRGCTGLDGVPHRRRHGHCRRCGSGALGGHPSLLLQSVVEGTAGDACCRVRPAPRQPRTQQELSDQGQEAWMTD